MQGMDEDATPWSGSRAGLPGIIDKTQVLPITGTGASDWIYGPVLPYLHLLNLGGIKYDSLGWSVGPL